MVLLLIAQEEVNIKLLIDNIHKYKKKDKMCVFYIDLKSAYNTVNRV